MEADFETQRLDFFAACGTPVEARRLEDRQGRTIYAMERGDGTPVVLLHGGGAEGAIWAPFLSELPEGTRAIVVDRPGCGLTYRQDYRGVDFRRAVAAFVEDVLDGLGLEQASFVANSMGGYFALCFALAHPERVVDLALLGAPAGLDRWLPVPIRLLGTPGINRVISWLAGEQDVDASRDLYEQMLVADIDRVPDALLEVGSANYQQPGAWDCWLGLLEKVATPLGFRQRLMIRDEVADLDVRTLFAWGTEDAFAPPSTGQELDEQMPDSQVWVVPDAGHLPWLDDPDTCGRAVRGFLRVDPALAEVRG